MEERDKRDKAEKALEEVMESRETQLGEALAGLGLGLGDRPWPFLLGKFSERPIEVASCIEGVEVALTVGDKPLRIKFGQDFLKIEKMGEGGRISITEYCGLNYMKLMTDDSGENSLLFVTNGSSVVRVKKRRDGEIDISYGGAIGREDLGV